MILTAPYINMNGNSAEQITAELMNIYKGLNIAIEAIQKASEYTNGRNATDHAHAQQMRIEKANILTVLNDIQNQYINLIKTVTNED